MVQSRRDVVRETQFGRVQLFRHHDDAVQYQAGKESVYVCQSCSAPALDLDCHRCTTQKLAPFSGSDSLIFFLSFACTKARLSSSVLTNACCMLTRTSTCNLRRLCSLGRSNLPHIGVAAARNNKVDHIAMTADFHRYLLLMVGYS